MYPAIPILYRKAMVDLQVGPYVIPKGTVVVCSLSGMHNSKTNFDLPSSFIPVRSYTICRCHLITLVALLESSF